MVLNFNGDLLVVRKKGSSYYMLPGGKIEAQETPAKALVRELQEELQFELPESAYHFLGTHRTAAANERGKSVCGYIFLLKERRANTPITPCAELEEVVWLTKENYKTYTLAHLLTEFALQRWLNG